MFRCVFGLTLELKVAYEVAYMVMNVYNVDYKLKAVKI